MKFINVGWKIPGFRKFIKLGERYQLSPEALYRLEIVGLYTNKFNKNASKTARYVGIHRNTVQKYIQLYDPSNLHFLEPKPTVPIKRYRKKIDDNIKNQIERLKQKYPYFGKNKIAKILKRDYGIVVSESTIGRVFRERKLTYLWRTKESACNFKKTIRKRMSRKRPPKVYRSKKPGKWIQIDTVKFGCDGHYVYVINAIDLCSRLAISYAYPSIVSKNARDFLYKLKQFFPAEFSIEMIQTDNGSEFLKYFHSELEKEGITHTFSYPKSPKMNSFVESYNKNIQMECLKKKDAHLPINALNRKIADYLVEYNTYRPHQSLNYKVPLLVYLEHWFKYHQKVHTKLWTRSSNKKLLKRQKALDILALVLLIPCSSAVEHVAVNHRVTGSNPVGGAIKIFSKNFSFILCLHSHS